MTRATFDFFNFGDIWSILFISMVLPAPAKLSVLLDFNTSLVFRAVPDLVFENKSTCCRLHVGLYFGRISGLIKEVILVSREFVVRPTRDHAADPPRDIKNIASANSAIR